MFSILLDPESDDNFVSIYYNTIMKQNFITTIY